MQPFDWVEIDGEWIATLPCGRTIIREHRRRDAHVPIGGEYSYDCSLELSDGSVFDALEGFGNFEQAAEWGRIRFVEMLAASRHEPPEQTVLAALEIIERELPADLHGSYRSRLHALQAWVRRDYESVEYPPGEPFDLVWQEHGDGLHADTPHGEVVIQLIEKPRNPLIIGARSLSQYRADIRHPSGATLRIKGRYGSERFNDLDAARAAAETTLEQFDDPAVGEEQLDILDFSLEIYRWLLPATSEAWAGDCLEYLGYLLGESLP